MSSRRKKQVLEWRKKGKTDLEIKRLIVTLNHVKMNLTPSLEKFNLL